MAARTWFKWLDKLARTVRGRQGRSKRRKMGRNAFPRLVLENLEDRIAPASDITIITSGVGSLDSVLAAHNGVITITDGANGGTQAETISVAALKALPATDNINIAARNNISFEDLTPVGGTLGLLTSTGHTAVFSAGSGSIQFANLNNNFFTAGGDIDFNAGANLTLCNLTSDGGAINLTTGVGGTFTASAAGGTLASAGGNITISADNIVIQTGIDAAGGTVTLQQATGGTGATTRNIDIGGGTTAGDLDLTDTELGFINAGVLRIGRLDNAGNITITDNAAGTGGITTHVAFNTLDLRSGGSINAADSNARIAVGNLALQSVGNAGTANNQLGGQVTTLAANVAGRGDSFFFFNQATLSIGSVDGVNGITTNDGPIQVFANGATLTVAADIQSQGGGIGLGGQAFVNSGTTTSGAAIQSGGGQIVVVADSMDLQAGSSINAGTGRVSLLEATTGTLINLGGANSTSPLTLGLTAAEINTITAGTLQIGDNRAGSITINAAIAPAHVATLDLQTGNAISEGANGSLNIANLALQAANGIGDNGNIQLLGPTNLAFANSATGNVMISDNGALTVAAVDALNNTNGNNIGNFASGGAILLTANGGPLTFAISTRSDSITEATTTGTTAGQNNITVNSGVTVAAVETNGVNFFSEDNILLQTGSTVTSTNGTVLLSAGAGGIDKTATIINDGTVNGINVNFTAPGDIGVGTVTATTTVAIVSANGAILDNNDTATAAVLNITATNLSLSANTGIGVSSTALGINATQAPLETQVSNVQAETATGGIFLDNGFVTPTTLTVGFAGQPLAGTGVQVTGASGDVQLVNNGSINVTNQDLTVRGTGNVTLQANGATADVTTGGDVQLNAIRGLGGGVVTVQAGRDITLGNANFGQVHSVSGSIVLTAGRNLTINSTGFTTVASGMGAITATAGGDITLDQGITTAGGAINLTTGVGGTVTLNQTSSPVLSTGGNITISADNIVLDNAINAGAGIVTLQQATGGTGSTPRNIDLGGGTSAGDLDITDAELAQITAGVLRIGRLDNAGSITITDNAAGTGGITTHAGLNTLDLLSGGNIHAADTKASIAVDNLALQSVGSDGSNNNPLTANVTNLAANITGQGNGLFFKNNADLSIGSVDGVNGLASNDGELGVIADPFTITVTDTPAANDIHSNGGLIGLMSKAFVSQGTTTAGAAIDSGGGQILILANTMDLQAGSTINAGTGRVSLMEDMDGTPINLGSASSTSPLTLGLTEAEINTITAGTLQIGDPNAGNITITAAIAPAHVSTLVLLTQQAIVEGANGSLSVANLALQANEGIGDAGAIQLVGPTNLAFNDALAGNVMISDNGALTITAVDSLNDTNGHNLGNFGGDGGIFLTASGGSLTFAISTSSNTVTDAITTGTTGQNDITVNSGVTVASVVSNNVFFSSANNVDLQTGSTVQSKVGNVEFLIGANDTNTISATLQGTVSGSAPVVQAGNGNASLLVDFANGANLPNGLTFTGGSGNNTLTVSDANDNTAHTYTITGSNVVRDGTAITFTKVAGVTVTGGNQADTFNVTPSPATTFTVNGGNPTPPALPGDTLNVNLAGLTTPQLAQSFNPASGFAGAWSFGNANPVNFMGMETLLPAVAQLAVTLDATPNPVFANGNLTYTVTVTNNGPGAAQNVTLSDSLPSGETFISQSQSAGPAFTLNNTGNAITDTIASLPSGASASFTILAHVAADLANNMTLTNTATASTTTMQTSTVNNSATVTTRVNAQADLTVTASGPVGDLFGNTLTYTYTLANNGPSSAANIVLTAALPAGVNVVSARQLSGNDPFTGSTVTFTAPVVAAGDSAVFQVIVSVAGGAGRASSLRSTATVTSGSFDPNMGNNAATTPNSLLTVLSNQLQVDQQAFGQLHSPGGETTALQQFLFWFSNASAVSGGAVPLIVDELLLALGEMATAEGLPLQGFINAQESAIVANPLYGTVSGYELGLWSGALASILF